MKIKETERGRRDKAFNKNAEKQMTKQLKLQIRGQYTRNIIANKGKDFGEEMKRQKKLLNEYMKAVNKVKKEQENKKKLWELHNN